MGYSSIYWEKGELPHTAYTLPDSSFIFFIVFFFFFLRPQFSVFR